MRREELLAAVQARFPSVAVDAAAQHASATVPLADFRALMQWLRADPALALDYPMNMTAVDWPEQAKLTCVYHLYSTAQRHALLVHCDVPREAPRIPTVSDLWLGCDWFEREAYDLLGVEFENHPDLRRIMLTDDWVGFPLRKDYKDSRIAGKPY